MGESKMGERDDRQVRDKLLRELYMSIDRMNLHLMNARDVEARAEKWHQRALRKDFKKLNSIDHE